ncbi:MAG: hypothetical protein WBN38_12930 [Polyangiales bacterium]
MKAERRPDVRGALGGYARPNGIEIDVGGSDCQVGLRLNRLGVEALFKKLTGCGETLVSNLRISLRDPLNECAERRPIKRGEQEMYMILHQAQRIKLNRAVLEAVADQPDEEVVVPWVGK